MLIILNIICRSLDKRYEERLMVQQTNIKYAHFYQAKAGSTSIFFEHLINVIIVS